jgi:hypothetical protein
MATISKATELAGFKLAQSSCHLHNSSYCQVKQRTERMAQWTGGGQRTVDKFTGGYDTLIRRLEERKETAKFARNSRLFAEDLVPFGMVPMLSQINLIKALRNQFTQIHFNIIIPSKLNLRSGHFYLSCPTELFASIYLSHAFCIPRPSQPL